MRTITIVKLLSAASTAAIALGVSASALADETGSGPVNGPLEEIVVTANKTESRLQKTPIAISTLSPQQLERSNIRSTLDLDKQVPGMTVSDSGAFPLVVTIRGVGYEGFQNNSAQPGVALVQNGVYIAGAANLASSFLDIAQVEVLRGPQGTVNGQNADGGALNISTVAPKLGKLEGSAEASYGSFDYYRLRAIANLPVGDTLAVRVALQREAHQGWMYAPNLTGDQHVGDQDTWAARLSALWQPIDRLSVNLWGEFYNNNSNGLAVRNLFDPLADPRATSNDYPTPQSVRSRTIAGTLSYDAGPATLKSITSYQFSRYNTAGSGDLLSSAEAVAAYGVKDQLPINDRMSKSFTQEINLASKPGGRLDWIVGAFYLHTTGNISVFETQQSTPTAYTPNFNPTPAQLGALFGAGLAFESLSDQVHESAAGFGQATFHIADHLRATGGLRYSWDKSAANTSNFYAPPAYLANSFTAVTGKASIEADIARASLVYASFSTGVKPGGTNLNPGSLVVPTGFGHEMVRAYEVGSKNEFFDHKLRVNLSAFYNDYHNLQVDSEDPLPFHGGMTNIPKSHIYGIEGEVSAQLPAGWRIDANASAMNGKVDSDMLLLDPYVAQQVNRATGGPFVGANIALRSAAFQNVKGHHLGRVAPFSSSIGLSNISQLSNLGELDTFLQLTYRAPFWFRVFNNPAVDKVPSQFTMNFNAHFQPKTGPWYLEFQITNLTNSNDVASRYAENFGVGAVFDALVPPRQFIGRVGVKF